MGLILGWLVPTGAPLVLAVDDTMFRRSGKHVWAACWDYDGSRRVAAGQAKLSRGNTFVVAAAVVTLPFLDRPIALPVLARLWRPGGPTKTTLAREMITLIATARRDRTVHVIADSAYMCKALRRLPARVTVTATAPLPRHAALWAVHPEVDEPPCMRGRRGRPRTRGREDRHSRPARCDHRSTDGDGDSLRPHPHHHRARSLVIIWYHLAGHHPTVVNEHRRRARWYATKTHPSYSSPPNIVQTRRSSPPEQIQAIRPAWADAAA
jgi:hypothetical protein